MTHEPDLTPSEPERLAGPLRSGEVSIVGAGPSGLACAIVLARAGWQVTVREMHETVGSRFHGDFQGIENWSEEGDVLDELAAGGIQATFDHEPVFGAVAFDARGDMYTINSPQPLCYLVHRGREDGSLDRALLDQARRTGVTVRFGDRVERVTGRGVLATGPVVAHFVAAGYLFDTDMHDGIFVCFKDSLAPLGYAYLVVHSGRGTVASCMFTGFRHRQTFVARAVEFFRGRAGLEMRNPRPFGGFGNVRLPATAMQGGHIVVGEQAGFQDAFAGFGIRYAIRSGILAARSLLESRDYTSMWREALLPQLRAGIVNRFMFSMAGERAWRWLLKYWLSGRENRAALRRLYEPSALTRILFPLAYVRYRRPLRAMRCNHARCERVWCAPDGDGPPQEGLE